MGFNFMEAPVTPTNTEELEAPMADVAHIGLTGVTAA